MESRLGGKDLDDFLIQVTHLYYQRSMTQSEIARLFSVSKMTVSRALKKAEEVGLVTINVDLPVKQDKHLSASLKRALGLRDAFVVNLPGVPTRNTDLSQNGLVSSLGEAAAFYVNPLIRDGMVLGVAVGRTVSEVARNLQQKSMPNTKVVQLIGGLGTSTDYNPYNLVQSVSERLGAQGLYFTGSAFLANSETRKAIIVENSTAGFPELWGKCKLCLVGLGTCEPNTPFITSGLVDQEELKDVHRLGAVGDLLGRYYGIDGKIIQTKLHDRVNAIPIDTLKNVETIVLVAGGLNKVRAIIGASRMNLPLTLITDDATANAILTSGFSTSSEGAV